MLKPSTVLSTTTLFNRVAWLRVSLVGVMALSLASCGFHLRGNIPLSEGIKNMYVVAPEGTFKDRLEDVLSKAGANLAPNEAGADVVLNVTRAKLDRSVGTLDERGKASSYNLKFRVRYNLVGAEQEIIRKASSLSETRRYDFDPEQVLESESEEQELQESMEEDLALRIVRQLSAVSDYQPK